MVFALLAGAALAQQDEIAATIDAQIEAFRSDDLGRAFSHASPALRRVFRNAENFGEMVRRGYPMVLDPSDIQYLELRQKAGSLWQKVRITDASGRVHLLDYQMVNVENRWKINAVLLLDPPVDSV